jgi:transglutaminase-like putative cysteine protease
MFCSSFGTIYCVLSAFEMQADYVVIALFLLTASLVMSFLHYHPVLFDFSYLVLLVIFIATILQNRALVNSGYQAMVNIIREDYQTYFGLNYTSEGVEAVSDRYRAITFAMVYLGFFLLVLLNIAISNYMSVFWNIVITFPFLQLGLYIEKRPSLFAIALLLFSYVSVAFLKRTGHYKLVTASRKDTPFQTKKHRISYKAHGKTMGQVIAWTFVFVFVVAMVGYPLATLAAPEENGTSALKAATDQVIENITQSGFSSLLNEYQASGGVSGGLLGGVSRISADYEPDLEVTFVPTSVETLYLKAFTGAVYTSSQWIPPTGEAMDTPSKDAFREATDLEGSLLGKMQIRNLDADTDYLYLPYYTSPYSEMYYSVDHGTLQGKSQTDGIYTVSYYPYTQSVEDVDDGQEISQEYRNAYLEIPENAKDAILAAAAEIGESSSWEETVELIGQYLEEGYQYTISPGTTPYDQDFVSYFLERQKKGYCSHFATAGTLLCRAYGIPARYVEGYAIQINDLADAEIQEDEDVANWLSGENTIENAAVVTVEVPDASAHAWTEIYLDGFGWYPVDFTPAASDVDTGEEYNSLMGLFAGIFSIASGTEGGSGAAAGNATLATTLSQNSFFLQPVGVLLLGVALFMPALWLARRVRRRSAVAAAYRRGEYDAVLPYYYQKVLRVMEKKKEEEPLPVLPQELFASLEERIPAMAADTRQAAELFERGIYGKNQVGKEEMDFFAEYTKRLLAALKKLERKR